jgi:hypothetical protein
MQDLVSKITKKNIGWRCNSSGKGPAYQVQGSELKPQHHEKKNRKRKRDGVGGDRKRERERNGGGERRRRRKDRDVERGRRESVKGKVVLHKVSWTFISRTLFLSFYK